MNELEELKARAAERRRNQTGWGRSRMDNMVSWLKDAEADLDRAIAIAESRQVVEDVNEILAANARNVEERDKAIAAAKALREFIKDHMDSPYSKDCNQAPFVRVLADTAWLEDHRPDRGVNRRSSEHTESSLTRGND